MELVKKVNALNYNNGTIEKSEEDVVIDETITLTINNSIKRSLSGIKDSLKEFTVGYLLGEDLIHSVNDIENIKINNNEISVSIKNEILTEKEKMLCSDSAGGWRTKIKNVKPVNSDLKITGIELIKRVEELKNNAKIWQTTGGTHVAGIVYENQFIVKEDVSRHVAVDKVIGYGALNNFEFEKCYIIYSGRMPADMVVKLTRVGIPILASNAAPAYSGYKIAEKGNITLIGFLRGKRFNIYGNTKRII